MDLPEGLFAMPQPFSRIIHDAHIALSPSALSDKPDMAILVTEIFAIWAHIENDLRLLLIRVLRSVEGPAIAIFSILETQRLQNKALDAAAKASLSPEEYEVFLAVLSTVEGAQTPRNHLAHWIWATCEQRKDLLALANPDMIQNRDMRVAKYKQSIKAGGTLNGQAMWDAHQFDPANVLAYSKADLERAKRDLEEARDVLFEFEFYINPEDFTTHLFVKDLTPAQLRDGIFDRLNGKRLFREALNRIRADRKSTQK